MRHLEGLVAVVFPPSHAYPALALVPLPVFLNALQAVFPLLFWSEVFKIQVNSIKPKFPSSILFQFFSYRYLELRIIKADGITMMKMMSRSKFET